jgi:hypothetical protein
MSAWWLRVSAFGVCFAVGAVLVPACADNESSIYIESCMAVSHDMCTATADPTAPFILEGTFDTQPEDVSTGLSQYECTALVGNQLVAEGNSTLAHTETSRVVLYEAEVTVLDDNGNIVTRNDGSAAQFTTPVSGFVDPGTGTLPGYGLTQILMIDSVTLKELAPKPKAGQPGMTSTVVSSVVLHGRTLGGNELTTAAFQFPIVVCYGCLCFETPGTGCVDSTDMPDVNCEVGQDIPVDCRYLNQNCGT